MAITDFFRRSDLPATLFRKFAEQEFDSIHVSAEASGILRFLKSQLALRIYLDEKFSFYIGIEADIAKGKARGVGVNRNFGKALFSALAEFVERYTFSLSPGQDLLYQNRKYFSQKGCDYFDMEKYIPAVGKFAGERFRWTQCRSFLGGYDIYIPAQLVFWDYRLHYRDEPLLSESNTSGTGGGFDLEKALVFGIYEVIERDAFLSCWLQKKVPRRIDVSLFPDKEFLRLRQIAKDLSFEVHFLDLTSDLAVPTCMVVLVDKERSLISRGFSTRFSWLDAVKKAFYEALGNSVINSHLFSKLREDSDLTEYAKKQKPNLWDRYLLWLLPSSMDEFVFLLGSHQTISPENMPRVDAKVELESLVKMLQLGGHNIYYCRAEHRILDQLGFEVVKVLIPTLLPMYFREENKTPTHAHPRLGGGALNNFPHPFA